MHISTFDPLQGPYRYLVVLGGNPEPCLDLPQYQSGTMAKDACLVGKVFWCRGGALNKTELRVVLFEV